MSFKISQILTALKYPNFRLFIAGQGISRIGTWMERTAVSWVVYDLTHSAFMLGVSVFCSQFPSFLFSIYGGIISDRHNEHTIVILTQLASLVQAGILALLVLSGDMEIWHILTLITLLGVINAFDVPARQSLLHQLVDNPEDLSNAVALNSSVVNIARLAGPALAGMVMSTWGAGICFSLNALSYIAVLISLFLLKLKPQVPRSDKQNKLTELVDSIHYLRKDPNLSMIMVYIGVISLLILPFDTLLPVFAKEVFHGGANTYGYITSCIGTGALFGAFFLATIRDSSRLFAILNVNALLLGMGLIAFSYLHYLSVALMIAVLIGFGALTQPTICLTILQTQIIPEMRGRLISLYAMIMFGMLPIGGLLVGAISGQIGESYTLLVQGSLSVTLAVIFYLYRTKKRKGKLAYPQNKVSLSAH